MTHRLPSIDWPSLLQRAPGFSAAIADVLCGDDPATYAPHVRAVHCFDLFDAQVSDGGVDQYFANVASAAEDFANMPALIACNPVFAPALPLIEEVHAIWNGVAADYLAADEEGDPAQCEALLAPHTGRLKAIATARPPPCDPAAPGGRHRAGAASLLHDRADSRGVEHVVLDDGAHRLRFENGFPVGPNTLEHEDGSCDVVWFSRDRTLLHADTAAFAGRMSHWIHYPSQASGRWIRNDLLGAGQSARDELRALGLSRSRHGLCENYRADGRPERSSLHWHGEELCSEFFYPDGSVLLRCQRRDEGELRLRYWPNGALNTECIRNHEGRDRYLRCLDPQGNDLAPKGSGRLREMLSLDDGMRQWREGALANGFLHGPVRRMASRPDGSRVRETECTVYDEGRTA